MGQGKVKILRFNPEIEAEPHYETYPFPFQKGMTVLDVVFHLREKVDGTLSFGYCCRSSHCGLCAAVINGQPGLMCRESATPEMTLEPLRNFTVIRDLLVDRSDYDRQMEGLRLYLERVDRPEKEPERISLPDLDRFKVVSRCVECYSCISGCPVVRENRHEFIGPAGLMQLARHALDPRDELNREVIAFSAGLYHCTHCGKCVEVCPHEIAPAENIELLRAQMIASGKIPRAVRQLIEMVEKTEKAVSPPRDRKPFLETGATPDPAPVGLFVGCSIDYDFRLMGVAQAAVQVLQALGFTVAIPAEQVCCGTPLRELGAVDPITELVEKNVEAFAKKGVREVLTLCSGCGLSLKKDWPGRYQKATGKDMPFQALDFTEFIARMDLPKDRLQPLDLKVTYHDACSLNRGQGIHAEPRKVLRMIPDLKLIEMTEPDYCCGGGGGLRLTHTDLSKKVLERKMTNVEPLEVNAIVTCCPTCMKQFHMALSQRRKKGMTVLHPAMLLAKALGVSPSIE
jgi:fumarate reductase (CoM/CoB) subunit B